MITDVVILIVFVTASTVSEAILPLFGTVRDEILYTELKPEEKRESDFVRFALQLGPGEIEAANENNPILAYHYPPCLIFLAIFNR